MSHAFTRDSRACAACISWGGDRQLAPDATLVHVRSYSVEGGCTTAVSQDYRKVTKAYHTCMHWAPLPMLKGHGGRPERPPLTAASAAPAPPASAAPAPPASAAPAPPPAAATVATPAEPVPAPAPPPAPVPVCRSETIDIDKTPPSVRHLHVYWRRLRGTGRMPPASVVDTGHVRDCVPRLCLLEPAGGGGDFVYRACGRAIQRELGLRPVGHLVTACLPPVAAERWLADLNACLAAGDARCLLVRDDPTMAGQRYTELLLPLADDHGVGRYVLAFRHLSGG